MPTREICPECGARLVDNVTCEDAFHQMLSWENEDPQRGAVHHLMVLAYHLQHPSLYTPGGLKYACQLLAGFVEEGISPQQVRRQNRSLLGSEQRNWKIKGNLGNQASYKHPVQWSMTVQDVVHTGAAQYIESVQQWAHLVVSDLRCTHNLP